MNYESLTSPCGIDCFNCEIYKDNVTRELQEFVAKYKNMKPEDVYCKGCKINGCFLNGGPCEAKKCADKKNVRFCFECDEFPCKILHPCLDGAKDYPQNFKLYNLLRIQKIGLERWAKEEAAEIRKRYKTGKLVLGSGAKLESELK
jgi:hypothetical protein